MTIEIKHRVTSNVLMTLEADTFIKADLSGANLRGANLREAFTILGNVKRYLRSHDQ